MLVCANGAPFLLGLPAAMASLGWVGGLSVLCFGFVCIQFCATRLVSLHEHQGKRHRSYRDLARGVLGERTLICVSTAHARRVATPMHNASC